MTDAMMGLGLFSGILGLFVFFFLLVCDDQLLLKPTPAGKALLGGSPPGVEPYPEARPWFLVEDLDDGEALRRLLRATFDALPAAKPKRSQPRRKRI